MLEVEIVGAESAPGLPRADRLAEVCRWAAAATGVRDGHLAIEFVDEQRMAELNHRHRARAGATDVLSFPVDETGPVAGPRELGDVVVCPARASDCLEATVHGVLHLCGMDHERDGGEMLSLQAEILGWAAAEHAAETAPP